MLDCDSALKPAAGAGNDVITAEDTLSNVTSLMTACEDEDEEEMQDLLSDRSQMSLLLSRDSAGRSVLHYCANHRRPSIINTIFNCVMQWSEDNTVDSQVAPGLRDVILSLLESRDTDGLTPLAHAVVAGNSLVVDQLLRWGADICCLDNEGHSVIHFATVNGHVSLLSSLHSAGADVTCVDVYGACALHYAAQMCGVESIDGCDNDVIKQQQQQQENETQLNVVQSLLSKTSDIDVLDQEHRTPLLWAASCGSYSACDELLKAGVNPDLADVDGLTALHCAASRGHVTCVERLMTSSMTSVDRTDRCGCTALFYAITLRHAHCVTSLLRHGANPSHIDIKGRSPAHCAATNGCIATLRELRSLHGNLWIASQSGGNYPIHEAAIAQQNDAVQYLIDICRDKKVVNLCNSSGRSLLHIAAMTNNIQLVQYLLSINAAKQQLMRIKSKELTAYDVAVLKQHTACADLLRQAGVKSASECPLTNRQWRHDLKQVVESARLAAALEAEYWVTDELQLQQRAAELVTLTVHNATSLLAREQTELEEKERRRREARKKVPKVIKPPKPKPKPPVKIPKALVYDDHATGVYSMPVLPDISTPGTSARGARSRRSSDDVKARLLENSRLYGVRVDHKAKHQRSPRVGQRVVTPSDLRINAAPGSDMSSIGSTEKLKPAVEKRANGGIDSVEKLSLDSHMTRPSASSVSDSADEQRSNGRLFNTNRTAWGSQQSLNAKPVKLKVKRPKKKAPVAGSQNRNIIQELVRVFEVKRLATVKLHDVKRHQLHNEYEAGCGGAEDQLSERQLTRKLVKDFNTEGGARGIVREKIEENNFSDVDQFEKYLRYELQRATENEKVLKRMEKNRQLIVDSSTNRSHTESRLSPRTVPSGQVTEKTKSSEKPGGVHLPTIVASPATTKPSSVQSPSHNTTTTTTGLRPVLPAI